MSGSRRIVVCHHGHENDVGYTENLFEFFSANGIDHGFLDLRLPEPKAELRRHLADGPGVCFLGFNSQIDHSWLDSEPMVLAAARHGATVLQWICDHPSSRWPEFNYPDPAATRFVFHTPNSQAYFERFCSSAAITAVAGSMGPNWRSRAPVGGDDVFDRRPFACLVALGLARVGRTAEETEAEIEAVGPLGYAVKEGVRRARYELDLPLEMVLTVVLAERGLSPDKATFNRVFRLYNDSIQTIRRGHVIRTASRFAATIQSDKTAGALTEGGVATFREGVSTNETLERMPLFRSVVSVSPDNDVIHDRTSNALNAGAVPILEDNYAHRVRFTHGENALLFRYDDDSLAECLALACGDPGRLYPIAERAMRMRDTRPFRFGSYQNIVALANLDPGRLPSAIDP